MRNDKQANESPRQPQQQTGEEFGSVKGQQTRNPERSDTARGSETRSAASRRG